MSPLKWLNNLFLMGNFLGIYRNYCSQKKNKKCFIIFQIFIQTMLHTTIVVAEARFILEQNMDDKIRGIHGCFSALTYLNSMSSVVTGICYSRAFMSYYRSVTRVSESFEAEMLNNFIKKTYRFSITFIIFAIVFCVYRAAEILIHYLQSDGDSHLFIFVSVFVSQAFIRVTIVFQNIMLFVVIMIVVHLIECLNSLISSVQERVGSCDVSSDEQCIITREQIQGWVKLYRDLANCCEKVTLCFGGQFLFSLVMSMTYYMLLTNHMCNKNVPNKGDKKTVCIVLCFIAITMLPIVAGQFTRNQWIKLRRVLARLYNTMLIIDSGEAEAKLVKDFIRLIKKNPLEIKILSKIPAGMYILPVILTLAVNYLIVILQFNNVI